MISNWVESGGGGFGVDTRTQGLATTTDLLGAERRHEQTVDTAASLGGEILSGKLRRL